MGRDMQDDEPNPQQQAENLARKLVEIQTEITGLEDKGGPSRLDSVGHSNKENQFNLQWPKLQQDLSSVEEDLEFDESVDLKEKLGSAKKVMELLARMRPEASSCLNETLKNQETHSGDTPRDSGGSITRALLVGAPLDEMPTSIGRFQVQRLLGQGGFGLVFLADDPSLMRQVALKVPTFESLLNKESQTRFKRESRVVASLSHPNIVPVFEVGNDGPISFIASEYIAGTDLSKWISDHGPLSFGLAANTTAKIADAINHAHRRKVIHRDLKPANILLEIDENDLAFDPSSVRVADFGLAKMVTDRDASLSRTGSVIGTPAFSAPEQLKSTEGHDANESADIYSLGAVLYYMLTGKAPFESSSIVDMVHRVVTTAPVAPRKIRADVPRDLSAICLKCMEKSPSDRYASIHEAHQDLLRFIGGQPVLARPLPVAQRVWKWCQRNRMVATLSMIASIAVVGGLIASLWSAGNARIAAAESRQQYLQSKKVIDEYFVKVTENPMFLSARYKDVKVSLLESARSHYEQFLLKNADDPELLTEIIRTHYRIADSWRGVGDNDKARSQYSNTLEMVDAAIASDPDSKELDLLRALSLAGLGALDQEEGKIESGLSQTQTAIEILEELQLEATTDQDLAFDVVRSYQTMVHLYRQQRDPASANAYSLKQQAMLDLIATQAKLDSRLQCLYAISLGDQSLVARGENNMARSLDLLNQSTAILEQLIENEPNPDWFAEIVAGNYYRRATHYVYSGQNKKGFEDAKKASQTLDSLALGNHAPDFLGFRIGVMNLTATCLQNLGKKTEGNVIFAEALLAQRKLVRQYPDLVRPRVSLATMIGNNANIAIEERRLNEASEFVAELGQLLDRYDSAGLTHPALPRHRVSRQIMIGRILHRRKDFSGAITHLNRGLDIVNKLLIESPEDPRLVGFLENIYDNRAHSWMQLGQFSKSVADRRDAIANGRGAQTYNQLELAECLARAGQISDSRDVLGELEPTLLSNGDVTAWRNMKLAFIHATIAATLNEQIGEQTENENENSDDLADEFNMEMELAESLFLKAFEEGYFVENHHAFDAIDNRPHLRLFFDRPAIKPVVEDLRRARKATQ